MSALLMRILYQQTLGTMEDHKETMWVPSSYLVTRFQLNRAWYLKLQDPCHWLQVFTVVEIKIDYNIALDQLLTYVTRIFMECIDWLFVIAFTLSEHSFCMHLFDHSRVVSSAPLNIHKVSIQWHQWWKKSDKMLPGSFPVCYCYCQLLCSGTTIPWLGFVC